MDKPLVQVNFSEVLLKEVSFNRPSSLSDETYKIDVVDSIVIDEVDSKSFKVIYTRETKGDIPFGFKVVFEFVTFLDDQGIEYYNGDLDKIKNFAEARKVEIINNMGLAARASLLIGNIVKEVGNPFITQPAVIVTKK